MILGSLFDAIGACTSCLNELNNSLVPYTSWYFSELHTLLPEPFFNTQSFLTFFAVVFSVYWLAPRRWRMTRIWLLVFASFHFYAAWSKDLAFLVTSTALADYFFGKLMDSSERKKFRFGLALTSISMNLGILCYFKYRGFFLNELYDSLVRLGYDPGYGKLDLAGIIVPFGISFYTFEAISYAVDVYRRKISAEKSLGRFLLFILFFPHLVSGPIVRAGDFLRQTHRPKRWNWIRVQIGVQFFLMGLFKKMAIADRMAVFCDPIFKNPGDYSTGACWIAVLAYAMRIYCDFSGYSDMAVGLAHLFGYNLTYNFNLPYISANISEFWRRWHISLSTWLRDYVFIPLGGSRGGRWLNYRNLMITMILGGLWHGAAWGYVLWGVVHGLMLVLHKQFKDYCASRPELDEVLQTRLGTVIRVMLTFFCVSMCWVLFQPEIGKAVAMYEKLFSFSIGKPLPLSNQSLWFTVAFIAICHLLVRSGAWKRMNALLPAPVLGLGFAMCLCLAMLLAPATGSSFIYFQF
jgi:alginate O-acetyltransferase complex protein AlgI